VKPKEYVAALQVQRPIEPFDLRHVSARAEAAISTMAPGTTLGDFARHINETDYARYLLQLLKRRMPAELAELLDGEVFDVGTLGDRRPEIYVKRVNDAGYAILFHSGLRDLIYRVTRIIASRAYPIGTDTSSCEPGMEETARLLSEVFWWIQESAGHRDELFADILGLQLSMGVATASPSSDPNALPYRYAGAELALQIFHALELVGFDVAESHPPSEHRLSHLRAAMRSRCPTPESWRALSSMATGIEAMLTAMVRIIREPAEHELGFPTMALSY
jgi:hypothetical protein